MSAVAERPVDFGAIQAGATDTDMSRRVKLASDVRWVWQPFRDIKLFDNLGPAVQNSLTLREKKNRHGEPVSDPVTALRRCQPYPLTNCEYEVPIQEAVRHNTLSGAQLPDNVPGNYAGASPKDPHAPRHAVEDKFAYFSAKELSDKYAKEYGLVVLEPLTGVEDSDVVRQVFELVQPMTYPLHKLRHELTEGMQERIRKAKPDKKLRALAEGCAAVMLKGVANAEAYASERHGTYARGVQLASAGQKGNRAFPTPFDEFVAEQLGVEVPRVVQTQQGNRGRLEEALARRLEREDDGTAELRALLEQEREERRKMQEQLNALLTKEKVA